MTEKTIRLRVPATVIRELYRHKIEEIKSGGAPVGYYSAVTRKIAEVCRDVEGPVTFWATWADMIELRDACAFAVGSGGYDRFTDPDNAADRRSARLIRNFQRGLTARLRGVGVAS